MKIKKDKIDILLILTPFLAMGLVLTFMVFIFSYLDSSVEESEQSECEEICYSKNEIYYKNKAATFENSICYCKDLEGGINTYPF